MKLQTGEKHEDTAKPVKSREIVVAGVQWPSLAAWWREQPQPKCSYDVCHKRVRKGEKYEDAIRLVRIVVAGVRWPSLMAWWKAQPEPKCSYNWCSRRVKKGEKYEDTVSLEPSVEVTPA